MTNHLALKVAALKVLSDRATDAYNRARQEIATTMERGDRLQVRSPIDKTKIGPVYMTDPKPQALVTDERDLLDWYEENHPELVETVLEPSGSDAEINAVLAVHAPHLLREKRRISVAAMRELRARSIDLGQPVGPGGELDVPGLAVATPDGVVACKPDPETALPAVIELYRSGQLDLATVLRPALEAAE